MRLLGLVCLGLAGSLGAQSVQSRLEGRIPAASIPVIDSLVMVAERDNLPTDPLIQKAIEGGAKRMSADRISKAVKLTLIQERQAQDLLELAGDAPPTTPGEVVTVMSARKRGLRDLVVARLVKALPDQPRGPALQAVADLVAHDFDADSAADLIVDAVSDGVKGERLLDVSGAAVQEVQRGRTFAQAITLVRQELPNVPAVPRIGEAAR